MKLTLVTTLASLEENKRIEEEVTALGHEYKLIDLKEFSFLIENGAINVAQLQNFEADVVIMRGIFNSIKAISVIVNDLRKKGIKIFDNNFLEHRYSIDKV